MSCSHVAAARLIRTLHLTSHAVAPPPFSLGTWAHFSLSISLFLSISDAVCVRVCVWLVFAQSINKRLRAKSKHGVYVVSSAPADPSTLRSPLQGHAWTLLGSLPSNTVRCSSLISTQSRQIIGQCFCQCPLHMWSLARTFCDLITSTHLWPHLATRGTHMRLTQNT